MKRHISETTFFKIMINLAAAWVLYRACYEFYQIAWGTGVWLGEFSRNWAILFFGFVLFSILFFGFVMFLLWRSDKFKALSDTIVVYREKYNFLGRVSVIIILIVPVYFFQYTPWGIVFQGLYFRVLVWGCVVALSTILLSRGKSVAGWVELLASLVLTASIFSIAASVRKVSSYPFSLGWSEGNRLWDYSVLFRRDIYDVPPDKYIPVLLDIGRKITGGIPFLIPGISIAGVRLWLALLLVIPYILVGLAAFYSSLEKRYWLFAALWAFMFLKQGPIHSPLVFCAFAVALIWNKPLWLASIVVALTGYAAQASRITWLFAPALWIGMLELAGASLRDRKLLPSHWVRAIALGLSGAFGGFLLPRIVGTLSGASGAGVTVSDVELAVTIQPLLWYRLLPNSTYGAGILLGLLAAVGPLVVVLLYLSVTRRWMLNIWQKLAIILPLSAFLFVGLVASTKIGGGGDLHNMDMFLIGALFTAAIAWNNGGQQWVRQGNEMPLLIKLTLASLIVIPALGPLQEMRSYNFGEDLSRLVTLTDTKNAKSLDLLPSRAIVETSLETIRNEVAIAKSQGEVLFIDQRQLLTFGYIRDVPFVPEYEKKFLMNEALSSNLKYFEPYYADLAAHRFSLIITEPLRTPIKDRSYQFGEENNAWVKWVANPTLCYYEPKQTLKEVSVQLLVPKQGTVDCSKELPQGGD